MKIFKNPLVIFFVLLFTSNIYAQKNELNNNQKTINMKWSTEIFTTKIDESKEFYCKYFGFAVKFELEGFVILQHLKHPAFELLFCVPDLPFNHELFHPAFQGQGVLFQMEVDDVATEYERIKKLGLPIRIPLVDEPVNGKHFTVVDPNNIPVDIVEFPKD